MHPQVWKCSGHYDLFRDMMVDCRECKGRWRADHLQSAECPRKPSKHPGEFEKCQLTEPREFNLMFKTIVGAMGTRGGRGLPAAGNGPGHLRQLQERARQHARQDSVRHRADRQELPQRDHAAELHVPLARVRADGDRVLLPSQHVAQVVRILARPADGVVHGPGPGRRAAAAARARQGRAEPLLVRHGRHRIRVSVPGRRASSASWKASPIAATSTCAATWKASSSRTPRAASKWRLDADGKPKHKGSGRDLTYRDDVTERAVHAARDRAVGRRRPGDAGVPVRGLPRGPGAGRQGRHADARRDEIPSADRAGQGGRVPAGEEGRHARGGPGDLHARSRSGSSSFYDEKGAVGRRYRRQDEAGTPFCITVDGQTLQDSTVTIRDRDSLEQWRVKSADVVEEIAKRVEG